MNRAIVFACLGACVGLRAQPAVKPVAGQTLSIGVVVDTHPQQASVIEFERHVVDSISSVFAGSSGAAFVIAYSDHVQPVSDWSPVSGLTDAAARIALDDGAVKGRGAVLNDGVMTALNKLGDSGDGPPRGLIVIGEGNDDRSAARFGQVLKAAREQHIACFALFVANHRAQVGRVRQFGFDLDRLASGTGGKAYDIRTDVKSLDRALADVQRRLREQRPRD